MFSKNEPDESKAQMRSSENAEKTEERICIRTFFPLQTSSSHCTPLTYPRDPITRARETWCFDERDAVASDDTRPDEICGTWMGIIISRTCRIW